mmetsp:Transcript_70774/g.124867  ORF Transcript_70774/g.124867 Transcript_70774/m.124867 type:complete len:411 (-) Transcript_70774:29-1261(-)
MASEVHQQIDALAAGVRELKASLKAQGLKGLEVNRHEEVVKKVELLLQLKSQLSSDDPAGDEAFFARQRQEKEEAQRRKQADLEEQSKALQAEQEKAPQPLIQRKIFHLFQHAGSGASFCYMPPPRLNSKDTGFGEGDIPHPAVYVTEKWDGTTMQATSTHIFKRLDLWGKRRDGQDPSQRYDLRLLAWRGEDTGSAWRGLDFVGADSRLFEALSPQLERIASLEAGLCVYFEAVHTDINANFKSLPGFAGIRVFDFSRSEGAGRFLAFEETIDLAACYGLPIVGWARREQLVAEDIWQELAFAAAEERQYATAPAPIEGFVVREAGSGGRIAKARVEQLHGLESSSKKAKCKNGNLSATSPVTEDVKVITYADGFSKDHLQAIGLFPKMTDRPILLHSRVTFPLLSSAR